MKPIVASALALAASLLAAVSAPGHAAAQDPCLGLAVSEDVSGCVYALRNDPTALATKRALARVLIAIGDFDGAIGIYQAIAAVYPDDAEAQADLGGSLGFVRRYVEAVAPMEAVIRLTPGDVAAHRAAAVVYGQLGQDADVFRVTLKAARLGDAVSMYDLHHYYRDGVGVERDRGRALTWAERAAEHGHLGALQLMVRIHLDGLMGEDLDEAEAGRWAMKFRKARQGLDKRLENAD